MLVSQSIIANSRGERQWQGTAYPCHCLSPLGFIPTFVVGSLTTGQFRVAHAHYWSPQYVLSHSHAGSWCDRVHPAHGRSGRGRHASPRVSRTWLPGVAMQYPDHAACFLNALAQHYSSDKRQPAPHPTLRSRVSSFPCTGLPMLARL